MPIGIVFEIEGEKHIERSLMISAKSLETYFKPLKRSADLLLKDIDQAFESEGAIFGGWPPLSPQYEALKSRQFPGKGILEREGKMRQSFRNYVGTHELIIDNPVEYFKYHQSNKPRSKIPRRVMLFIRNVTKENIIKFFQEYIQEATADWGRVK